MTDWSASAALRYALLAALALTIVKLAVGLVKSHRPSMSNGNQLHRVLLCLKAAVWLGLVGAFVLLVFSGHPAVLKTGPWLRASLLGGALGIALPLLMAFGSRHGAGVLLGITMALPAWGASTLVCALLWFFVHLPMAHGFVSVWPEAWLLALFVPQVLLAQVALMALAFVAGKLFARHGDAGAGAAFIALSWLPSQFALAFLALSHVKAALG